MWYSIYPIDYEQSLYPAYDGDSTPRIWNVILEFISDILVRRAYYRKFLLSSWLAESIGADLIQNAIFNFFYNASLKSSFLHRFKKKIFFCTAFFPYKQYSEIPKVYIFNTIIFLYVRKLINFSVVSKIFC